MTSKVEPSGRQTAATKRLRRQRGQSLVEFALVIPLFLVILMATVDFGWALRAYITITNSAREGARVGAVGASEADIENKVVSSSNDLLDVGDVTVTGAQGAPGTSVIVTVDYDYNFISPLGSILSLISGGAIPNPLPMTSTTTMRME